MTKSDSIKWPRFKLIIGLGNPGEKYAKTYHNTGFLALEYLKNHLISRDQKFKKIIPFEYIKINNLILIKPTLFMNQSGRCATKAISFFKTPKEKMLVIHDDSDLNIGRYKLDFDSGAAGNKGVI